MTLLARFYNGPWAADPTGYPLIFIEPLQQWLQLLPVSKPQFERFSAEPNQYGDQWYQEVLAVNPRVSFRNFNKTNYEQVFLTGLQLEEAHAFGQWLGQDFALPTIKQWRTAYKWLNRLAPLSRLDNEADLSLDAHIIWERLQTACRLTTLAQQAFLSGGILEWVQGEGRFPPGGMGQTRQAFWSVLREPTDRPVRPINSANRDHLKAFGARLLRRSL